MRIGTHKLKYLTLLGLALSFVSCSTWKEYDEKLLENKEFDKSVRVKEIAPEPEQVITEVGATPQASAPTQKTSPAKTQAAAKPSAKTSKNTATTKAPVVAAAPAPPKKHEPALEDGAGFNGRRPIVEPFRPGETITYSVNYFAMEGGRFTTTVGPLVEVNGKKSYHFVYKAKSSSVFSMFYAVEDEAEAYLDYENLVPYSYSIKARESKQIRDVKNFFNWQTMKAKTWDKKIKKGKGPEEKNLEWDLLPYSQNVFTVAYYLRCFELAVGKEFAVRVAHDGKNIIMRAKVVREETISTPVGKLETYVVKPQFEIAGAFKPVGDIFMWLTKDERKMLVRIESKLKIGTIYVAVEKIQP